MTSSAAAAVLGTLTAAIRADLEQVDSVVLAGVAEAMRGVAAELDAVIDARTAAFASALDAALDPEPGDTLQ